MTTTVAQMRKRIEAQNAKPILSPAQIAERERNNDSSRKRAIRVAKARAARYNMTLRSMTIQSAMKMQQIREEDMQSIKDVKAKASKYSATSRGIALAVPRKHFDNLGHALDAYGNPKHALQLVEAVAEHVAGAEVDDPEDYVQEEESHTLSAEDKMEIAETSSRRKSIKSVKSVKSVKRGSSLRASIDTMRNSITKALATHTSTKSMASEVHSDSGDTVTETEGGRSRTSSTDSTPDGFYMSSLATAIQKGDEDEVNKAILKEFLEEHDPSRLDEVDELLLEYHGREADLFTALTEEYPDPSESFVDDIGGGDGSSFSSFIDTKETFADGNARGRALGELAFAVVTDMENKAKAEKEKKKKKEKAAATAIEEDMADSNEKEEAAKAKAARAAKRAAEELKKEEARAKTEAEHARKKDEMLKQQLKVYGKGSSAMSSNNNKKKSNNSRRGSKRGSKTKVEGAKRASSRVSTKSTRSSTNSLVSTSSSVVEKKRPSKVTMSANTKQEDAGDEQKQKRLTRKMSSKKSLTETGFILSGVQIQATEEEGPKWAVNVQARVLKERMMKAGVSETAIAQITGEDSGML